MKKLTILLFFALVGFTSVNAQVEQIVNKNGVPVMPEAGQFAIGFNALPFFGYVGDMFNGTSTNTSLSANFVSNNSGLQVYGKYFLSETNAIRGRVRVNHNIVQDVNRVAMDGQANPQSNIEVEDQMITRDFTLELGGGMEWRRGKGRLIGVYGGEAFIGLNTSSRNFTYGNGITEDNQDPSTSTFFFGGNSATNNNFFNGERVLSVTNANNFSIGARGFAGVEYFFAPQMSIGAEVFLGLAYTGTNRSQVVTEEWNGDTNEVLEINDIETGVLTGFGINTDNYGGAINLMLHF